MSKLHRIKAYSALEEAEINDYAAGISQAYPEIVLDVERLSTTALFNRLIDENDDPQWNMIFGIALSAVWGSEIERNLGVVPELYGSPVARGRWYCPSGFVPVFCVNEERLDRLGLKCPESWSDLVHGDYFGEIVIPDPNYSGAGKLHLTALIECAGDRAWPILEQVSCLSPLIVQSTKATCEPILSGDRSIAVTVSTAAAHAARMNPSLKMLAPRDAGRFEPEAFGIRENASNFDVCQKVVAWMAGEQSQEVAVRYSKFTIGYANSSKLVESMTEISMNVRKKTYSRSLSLLGQSVGS